MNFVNFVNTVLPWVGPLFTIVLALAIGLAFRTNYTKTAAEIQKQLIEALTLQNEVKDDRIKNLERRIARLEGDIATIKYGIKRSYGISIHVNGEFVSFEEKSGRVRTTPIQKGTKAQAPPKPTPGEEGDDKEDEEEEEEDKNL